MFSFLKNRLRKEHVKLLKQNELAARYLLDFSETSIESGMGGDPELVKTFVLMLGENEVFTDFLKVNDELPSNVSKDQMSINGSLRRLYDEVLASRKMFAQQFGSASEPLLPFDKKSCPHEGWKIHYVHFG